MKLEWFDTCKARGSSIFFIFIAALFSALLWSAGPAQANWPRWRGPEDQGSASEGSYPATWDPGKALWKAPLPGKGCSTPPGMSNDARGASTTLRSRFPVPAPGLKGLLMEGP